MSDKKYKSRPHVLVVFTQLGTKAIAMKHGLSSYSSNIAHMWKVIHSRIKYLVSVIYKEINESQHCSDPQTLNADLIYQFSPDTECQIFLLKS